ncbi:MAG: polysaccharide biosynthesis tyrosine autokinase, partial [Candidatus Eremiobacteraeota bacterium]|nr:polysaccharide biosynthesis tyrosine autokinase [Candidatus Eremiobacteraeota bacterium]
MNLHLPSVKTDATSPAKGDGAGVPVPPGYTDFLLDQSGSGADLSSKILLYIGLVRKHKLLIIVVVAIFMLGGVIATMLTPKIYSASTTIEIDRSVPKVFKSRTDEAGPYDDTGFYQTQYELIRSRALAERVATALDLGQSDFLGQPQPSLLKRLFGLNSNVAPISDANDVKTRQAAAAGAVMGGLSVQPVGQSSIVRIRYSARDPAWAQRISIAVAEQYEKLTLDMRFAATTHARNFLQERLDELRLKLEESEKQLIQYAQKEGIVDVDNKQPQVIAEMQTVQAAYSSAVTARLQLEETWRQAQADDGNSLPQVMGDQLIQSERTKLAELRATYQDKLAMLKPAFPEMIAIKNEISEMESGIHTQIARIKDAINEQYKATVANEKALNDKLSELKAEALDLRSRSVQYSILTRELDTNRSLYDGVLQQYRELGVASDAEVNNVSILDRAELPGAPTSPSLKLNLILALASGALTAAGAVWLIEVLDDTFKTAEDLEEGLRIPVLGVIPLYRDPAKEKTAIAEILDDPSSPLAESYRSLRTAIQFSTSDGAPRSLLVTSARPSEGKSTVALSVAANFAQLGMRVLLIDADLRNPSLHRVLNLENNVGLSNYLSGARSEGDTPCADPVLRMVKQTSIPNLAAVVCGPLPPNPAELLAGPRFGVLLTEASESFDMVIVDAPPIMGLADVPILSAVVEATMMVVEGARTRRNLVRDGLKRLHFARARVVGGVLNKYHAKHAAHYGYGYGYGYGY